MQITTADLIPMVIVVSVQVNSITECSWPPVLPPQTVVCPGVLCLCIIPTLQWFYKKTKASSKAYLIAIRIDEGNKNKLNLSEENANLEYILNKKNCFSIMVHMDFSIPVHFLCFPSDSWQCTCMLLLKSIPLFGKQKASHCFFLMDRICVLLWKEYEELWLYHTGNEDLAKPKIIE